MYKHIYIYTHTHTCIYVYIFIRGLRIPKETYNKDVSKRRIQFSTNMLKESYAYEKRPIKKINKYHTIRIQETYARVYEEEVCRRCKEWRSCRDDALAHCNTLQHTATHCTTLHHTATHCNTLQNVCKRYMTYE